jgi:hypothetical protein
MPSATAGRGCVQIRIREDHVRGFPAQLEGDRHELLRSDPGDMPTAGRAAGEGYELHPGMTHQRLPRHFPSAWKHIDYSRGDARIERSLS